MVVADRKKSDSMGAHDVLQVLNLSSITPVCVCGLINYGLCTAIELKSCVLVYSIVSLNERSTSGEYQLVALPYF